MYSEDQLIERIGRKFRSSRTGLRIGIGDDAAVIMPSRGRAGGSDWVVTADAFLENVHFRRSIYPPRAVGYKALARATSDIAAMGARPRYFLLTLALPAACTGKWLDDFLEGMALAARRFGIALVGGDTTKYPGVIASITVIGEIDPGRAILRSGARPGDLVCVTGRLGAAELGLRLIQKALHKKKQWKRLTTKHFYPEPRLAVGQWLVARRFASAMIDTSDGLSTDLGRLCKASAVGARLWADKLPLASVPPGLKRQGFDPLELAIDGGEDYELLFTVPKRLTPGLPSRVANLPVTVIGEITREKNVTLINSKGGVTALQPQGWDPFRRL